MGRLEAQLHELGASGRGIERDRVFELVGCVSSIGERFTLAIAAGNEVALWEQRRAAVGSPRERRAILEMSQRAMAELFAYYLLGTGHGLASVVLRTLALEAELRPRLLDVLGASCVIDSKELADWPSLNVETCRKLRRVAKESSHPSIQRVVEPVTRIRQNSSWSNLDSIRGEDYHRRRLQTSLVDGVPPGSAWRNIPNGAMLAIGTRRPSEHDDNRTLETIKVMYAVEQLLIELPVLRARLDDVLAELGVNTAAK